jgi:hypothetical protein
MRRGSRYLLIFGLLTELLVLSRESGERAVHGLSHMTGVAFGKGKFVAVTYDGFILNSSDGENWSRKTYDFEASFDNIIFSGSMFVISGGVYGQSAVLLSSMDGEIWLESPVGNPYSRPNAIASSPQVVVAVGNSGLITRAENRFLNPFVIGTATRNDKSVELAVFPLGNSRIESSTDLKIWTKLQDIDPTSSGVVEIEPNGEQRFFRTVIPK